MHGIQIACVGYMGGETASDVQVHGMCSRMLTCSRMRASRLDVGFLMCNEN
ncbi:hypothetical protein COLINT_03752 [Collinsella intestinalis DSM 13280]|uniref:Uncharacterized protein n=1 Tax=Collinsella intestinalis DSM 13280 TaxID=521003 RepID=C4FCD2_9ACTN|nr:hypothetical protein COLINT_03752 [Collinsella intestinalis DSM 13280]